VNGPTVTFCRMGIRLGCRPAGSATIPSALRTIRTLTDLTPGSQDLPRHPFPTRYARRTSSLTFNIAGYARQLTTDFLVEGGKIERVEFHSPSELNQVAQKVVINATGYGREPCEGRVDCSGARSDCVADSAAGSELWSVFIRT